MPYNGINDSSLPSYVKKLSPAVKTRWIAVFNQSYAKGGESLAFKMANSWLKKHLSKDEEQVVAKSGDQVEYFSLKFEFPEEMLVIKAVGDEEFIEAVLTDVDYDNDGACFDESFLYELAEQINSGGVVGDFDHEEMEKLRMSGLSKEGIANALKHKQGVAKAVKALVSEGKLWIRAIIDKRYRKRILNSKGLSLEGLFKRKTGTNKYESGTILGFTFAEKQTPRNPRAKIYDESA